ncbi:MAG: helix-turn-helix domain-containing protein [Candidatus Latescibacteria bacterium]|nr:helix-turn-helix domain-containing protein [Candidatus Latescibacterota bacterium]
MDDCCTLDNPEQLKAIADPLRMKILRLFGSRPMTTKQVAQELSESPTRLYHHVATLESTGLIRLVETRPNRGTVEKYYQAAARRFVVARHLLAPDDDPEGSRQAASSLMVNALEEDLAQLTTLPATPEDGPRPLFIRAVGLRVSQARLDQLRQTIQEWASQCNDDEDEPQYTLTTILYPHNKENPAQ